MSDVMVYMTAKDEEEAGKIAEALLKEKLVACVNIIPGVESSYWWKGKIEHEKEVVMIAKSRSSLAERIVERVKELHSYDVPCVDVVPLAGGNPDYFKWVEEVLG